MLKINYALAIVSIVCEIISIIPGNAVSQDIFFGYFVLAIGIIELNQAKKFGEKFGINPDGPKEDTVKKAVITEMLFMLFAAGCEIGFFMVKAAYSYTATVVCIIGAIMVSRVWKGKINKNSK